MRIVTPAFRAMAATNDMAAVQSCLSNRLDLHATENKRIAGVIGDAPSRYSKSPALWNAAFRALGIDALYLAFDINPSRLADLVRALKGSGRIIGVNVTVPYKVKIMEWLDEVEAGAERIQAVNTIIRTDNGRLIGYNTDGEGFLESILTPQPGRETPFLDTLSGVDVLVLGAGGSARAVAFHLADHLASGRLIVCNRTLEHAKALAHDVQRIGTQTHAVPEAELSLWAPKVGLIVNTTVKGQGGRRKLPDGTATLMEPYSALAAACPATLSISPQGDSEFQRKWLEASRSDIEENNRVSYDLAASIPPHVRFCDLIYHPEETVFLRHGRLTGHATLNGKGMIIAQAAKAFSNYICKNHLEVKASDQLVTYRRIIQVMTQAW